MTMEEQIYDKLCILLGAPQGDLLAAVNKCIEKVRKLEEYHNTFPIHVGANIGYLKELETKCNTLEDEKKRIIAGYDVTNNELRAELKEARQHPYDLQRRYDETVKQLLTHQEKIRRLEAQIKRYEDDRAHGAAWEKELRKELGIGGPHEQGVKIIDAVKKLQSARSVQNLADDQGKMLNALQEIICGWFVPEGGLVQAAKNLKTKALCADSGRELMSQFIDEEAKFLHELREVLRLKHGEPNPRKNILDAVKKLKGTKEDWERWDTKLRAELLHVVKPAIDGGPCTWDAIEGLVVDERERIIKVLATKNIPMGCYLNEPLLNALLAPEKK